MAEKLLKEKTKSDLYCYFEVSNLYRDAPLHTKERAALALALANADDEVECIKFYCEAAYCGCSSTRDLAVSFGKNLQFYIEYIL